MGIASLFIMQQGTKKIKWGAECESGVFVGFVSPNFMRYALLLLQLPRSHVRLWPRSTHMCDLSLCIYRRGSRGRMTWPCLKITDRKPGSLHPRIPSYVAPASLNSTAILMSMSLPRCGIQRLAMYSDQRRNRGNGDVVL